MKWKDISKGAVKEAEEDGHRLGSIVSLYKYIQFDCILHPSHKL